MEIRTPNEGESFGVYDSAHSKIMKGAIAMWCLGDAMKKYSIHTMQPGFQRYVTASNGRRLTQG